ncbi:SDR family NAD(P)-dependent oxidoreductase [Clostridium sp. MCC353]|uniref:SDR family oxidoreductase n=1 Tax=Clostridium sp. MCC353 TaxID=2592646 RepID=UPI001C0219B4|nr:SDR family oxidoreductase [Clostridium sp. MCC353]MBT9777407.1 SDR family NAD(P)-dependent oxidoreductase [Clostridium sp. MCC353]
MNETGKLLNKKVVITGASSGMGEAIARTYAKEGADLCLIARSEDRLKELCRELEQEGVKAVYYAADLINPEEIEAAAGFAFAAFDRIDILVNCAGLGIFRPFGEYSVEEYNTTMDLNIRALFLMTQKAAVKMKEQRQGQIISIGSMAAVKDAANNSALYFASKWALMGLHRCMAFELMDYDIRVTLLNPGNTDTKFRPDAVGQHPEWIQAQDIADAALYVAESASNISIHEINISPTNIGWNIIK